MADADTAKTYHLERRSKLHEPLEKTNGIVNGHGNGNGHADVSN